MLERLAVIRNVPVSGMQPALLPDLDQVDITQQEGPAFRIAHPIALIISRKDRLPDAFVAGRAIDPDHTRRHHFRSDADTQDVVVPLVAIADRLENLRPVLVAFEIGNQTGQNIERLVGRDGADVEQRVAQRADFRSINGSGKLLQELVVGRSGPRLQRLLIELGLFLGLGLGRSAGAKRQRSGKDQ